jgi:hypothetical protein
MNSGLLLNMKDSRCAYPDYLLDVHPTLIVFGRLAVQPRQELVVPDAERWTRSSRLQLRSSDAEPSERAPREIEDRRLIVSPRGGDVCLAAQPTILERFQRVWQDGLGSSEVDR